MQCVADAEIEGHQHPYYQGGVKRQAPHSQLRRIEIGGAGLFGDFVLVHFVINLWMGVNR